MNVLRRTMKTMPYFKGPGRKRYSGLQRLTALFIACLFTAVFHISPAVHALTVEEAAGKREKSREPVYYDELNGKAQERRDDASAVQEKDPRLACMLSLIVPGGGQIYLREDLKGITFCLLSGAGYATSGYYLYLALLKGNSSRTEVRAKLIISGLLFVVAAIIHVVGVVEAYNDAEEINEKRFYFGDNRSVTPYIARVSRE
jgi:hypothetical protein